MRALEVALKTVVGEPASKMVRGLYQLLDDAEVTGFAEGDMDGYQRGFSDGWREGYDIGFEAAMDSIYGTDPILDDEFDDVAASAISFDDTIIALPPPYQGDSGDEG
jgi:hypothetical protein